MADLGNIVGPLNSASVVTVKMLSYSGGALFKPEWTTDGLKVPMSITFNDGTPPYIFYMLIPRDEMINMFKDLKEELYPDKDDDE